MNKTCRLFNQHRDGMLSPEQKVQFETHLATCDECNRRLSLLTHIVHILRNQEIPAATRAPERTADAVYEATGSLDIFLLSWLKPLPVWSGLAVLLILFSFLWVLPFAGESLPADDYEYLFAESSQQESTITNLSDDALETWLEIGGSLK